MLATINEPDEECTVYIVTISSSCKPFQRAISQLRSHKGTIKSQAAIIDPQIPRCSIGMGR